MTDPKAPRSAHFPVKRENNHLSKTHTELPEPDPELEECAIIIAPSHHSTYAVKCPGVSARHHHHRITPWH